MGFLDSLFGSDDDCGGGHVWGDWNLRGHNGEQKIVFVHMDPLDNVVHRKVEHVRQCQHEECTATETKMWAVETVLVGDASREDVMNTLREQYVDNGQGDHD